MSATNGSVVGATARYYVWIKGGDREVQAFIDAVKDAGINSVLTCEATGTVTARFSAAGVTALGQRQVEVVMHDNSAEEFRGIDLVRLAAFIDQYELAIIEGGEHLGEA